MALVLVRLSTAALLVVALGAPVAAHADTWTTGEVVDHIFAGGTLTYDTPALPAAGAATLELKYGLWNSPSLDMTVSLNGSELGTVTADAGYGSPGPAYETWDVTGLLVAGVNTIEVVAASSGGEAVVGALTLDYEPGVDIDRDGYPSTVDCDDDDPATHPDAAELCDGKDNDCDGVLPLDEDDEDDDGYRICEDDCDDGDDARYPGAAERCNELDDDCDGVVPDDELDEDDDGFPSCDGDCADDDEARFPGAMELCNGIDDDCDGDVPAEEEDADQDGFATCAGDCDDLEDDISPDATEVCGDGIDDDCDGADLACDQPDPSLSGECSCQSGGQGLGWALLPLVAVFLRRRRATAA